MVIIVLVVCLKETKGNLEVTGGPSPMKMPMTFITEQGFPGSLLDGVGGGTGDADDGLLVGTGDVVPRDAVPAPVEIVQDRQAPLVEVVAEA